MYLLSFPVQLFCFSFCTFSSKVTCTHLFFFCSGSSLSLLPLEAAPPPHPPFFFCSSLIVFSSEDRFKLTQASRVIRPSSCVWGNRWFSVEEHFQGHLYPLLLPWAPPPHCHMSLSAFFYLQSNMFNSATFTPSSLSLFLQVSTPTPLFSILS